MSSQYIKVRNNTLGIFPFSNSEKIIKKVDNTKNWFIDIKNAIEKVLKIAEPFISLAQQNPLTTLYKALIKEVTNTLDSFLATGASIILIHPFNQAGERKIPLNINLLNPVNELKETLASIKETDQYSITKQRIREIEDQLEKNPDSILAVSLKEEIDRLEKTLKKHEYKIDEFFNTEVEFPKLSASDAIQELIDSFYNKSDKYRPKWNLNNTVTGVGFLISATTQVELLNNLNALNKLFQITNLAKSYEKFKENTDSWSESIKKKDKERQKKVKDNEVKKLIEEYKTNAKPNEENYDYTGTTKDLKESVRKEALAKLGKYLADYTLSVYPSIDTLLTGKGPAWIPFTVEIIPMVKELKKTLIDTMEVLLTATEVFDSSIKAIVNSFVLKINSIIAFVDKVTEMLDFLKTLSIGISCTSFYINPMEKGNNNFYKDGGVEFMVDQLKEVQSFSTGLMDFSGKTEKEIQEIAKGLGIVQKSDFSCLLYIAMGYSDIGTIKKQFEKILTIFNLDIFKSNTPDSSIVDSAKIVTFDVVPFYSDYSIIVTDKNQSFNIIANSNCHQITYTITNITTGKILANNIAIYTPPFNFTIYIPSLKNEEKYNISITATNLDGTSIFTKEVRFTALLTSTTDISNSIPPIINNNSKDTQVINLDASGENLEFLLSAGQNLEIPLVLGDGVYTLKLYTDTTKKMYFLQSFPYYNSFVTLDINKLYNNFFYLREIPYVLYIPSSYGEYAEITFSSRVVILKLDGYIEIEEDEFYISFFKNGKWSDRLLIKNKLSTNIADFCLT